MRNHGSSKGAPLWFSLSIAFYDTNVDYVQSQKIYFVTSVSKQLFFLYFFSIFREKKLLVSSEDYGRDLTGVQNLRKKHKRLEAELGAHEPAIQVSE